MIKQAKDLVEGDMVYIPHAKQCCQVDVVNLTNIKFDTPPLKRRGLSGSHFSAVIVLLFGLSVTHILF